MYFTSLCCFFVVFASCLQAFDDKTSNAPMPALDVASTMQLPPGFRATCFASEPAILDPIAFTIDTRGRLWVVESMTYPDWQKSGPGKDRVIILEDTNGDGVHDTRKVFLENGRNLTGIELGFGGIWLLSAPELLFIPIHPDEDKPAGPPRVLLDGWNTDIKHNIVSNLTWGMDGWLYGCHGITLKSKVGKPDTPGDKRHVFDCCIWRFHPTREHFEVVCWGGTNPWGLDYDQYGNWFMTNCVIDHVFHIVPNAHYIRMFGNDPNPYVYHPLLGCADHKHWGGGKWMEGGRYDDQLGGHAHSGCMIYQEDNWPQEFHNRLFTLSIHGKRLQQEKLEYQGAVAVARHLPDFLKVKDSWFMGVQAKPGPDGSVYILDWNDTGECHSYVNTQRTTGRIYKVTYGNPPAWNNDLALCSNSQLEQLHQETGKEWHIRQARRLLQERKHTGIGANYRILREILNDVKQPTPVRLRALWTLHACEERADYSQYWLHDPDEWVRAWALRLACDRPEQVCDLSFPPADGQQHLTSTPVIHMTLASVLPRLRKEKRWQALELLAEHHPAWIHEHSSAAQHVTLKDWLLTLFWNGCESWVVPDNSDLPRLLALFQHPWHMEWAVRKLVTLQGMSALEAWAVTLKNKDCRLAFLQGLEKALENSSATYTPTWQSLLNTLVRQDASLLSPVQEIAAQLGDLQAQQALRERLASMTLTTEEQTRYLTILTRKSNQDLLPILLQLFENSSSRRQVIKSLARYDSDEVHSLLIGRYNGLTLDEKQDAIATLVARPRYARALLDALDAKTIPSLDILAPSVVALRQLQAVDIRKRVAERWGGEVTTEAIKERIGKLQNQLTSATLQQANLKKGRTLFDKHCATCHRLFGEGQAIGPELTGAQRSSLDYLLENTVNPNAIVPQDYRATTFVLQNGQVLTGMILSQQGDSLTIQTASEKLTIRKQDIEEQQQTSKSLMPEGLLDSLSLEEIRDLFGYLSSPKQISDK